MRKLVGVFMLLCFIIGIGEVLSQNPPRRKRRKSSIDSTVFRGNWWGYYNRAIRHIEAGRFDAAEKDLRAAVKKRSKDDPEARSYGVHFQEYYPHAELGVLLYDSGHYEEALRELGISSRQAPLEQTLFFLHEARRKVVGARGLDQEPPHLDVLTPEQGQTTNQLSILVKGRASDDVYVDQVTVGGERLFLEKAQSNLEFQKEVPLPNVRNEITVSVADLVGKRATKTLEILVDRQGPVFSLDRIELLAGQDVAVLSGSAYDRSGIESLHINDRSVSIETDKRIDFEELRVSVSVTDGLVHLMILDSYGNATHVDIDPRKQMGSASGVLRPVQVAAIHFDPRWLVSASPESGTPKITVKNLESGQNLFVNEYLVEIEVTDREGVEEVRCNGEPLDIVPGKKNIHSSYVWGPVQRDCTKTLEIWAKDSTGKTALHRIQTHFDVLTDLGRGRRLSVLLSSVDILGASRSGDLEEIFKTLLDIELNRRNRFDFAPNEEALNEILQERILDQQSFADMRHRIPSQSLLTADLFLTVDILPRGDCATAAMSVSHKKSGASRRLIEATAYSSGLTVESLEEMARTLSHKLSERFPVVEGEITDTTKTLQCSLCKEHGVVPGIEVIAFRELGGTERPSTKTRTSGRHTIGPMSIKYVWPESSELLSGEKMMDDPRVGDKVVTR